MALTRYSFVEFTICIVITILITQKQNCVAGQPYYANKCETHTNCENPCGNIEGLKPRCDRAGVCVCDCSDMAVIDSHPVPEDCKETIDSYDKESCIKYSGSIYNRPTAQICGKPGIYLYCTSLCKYY